jgi:hypothetical protein
LYSGLFFVPSRLNAGAGRVFAAIKIQAGRGIFMAKRQGRRFSGNPGLEPKLGPQNTKNSPQGRKRDETGGFSLVFLLPSSTFFLRGKILCVLVVPI